ncbi:MAG: hypothetical protein A2751_03170 [Candidatus Doudnabacteria bacterium RIFCSPHIGHO2_01_FULL_46_14]|uniref:Nudix hydrolase domain-containing protein n=1 Tax=Candidatus Doudnabacteria bacterium RIFCSPHIGHO2_01_FULL_46_14 TaxID=1817824 RepID=A0A1F5NKJ5_9BACT|nr:MAG: hypothetical protein A2751_03170 [Candidatus Doudnabacteria bacterium RIFCSPHIGHO2_01_FULL_46_14]
MNEKLLIDFIQGLNLDELQKEVRAAFLIKACDYLGDLQYASAEEFPGVFRARCKVGLGLNGATEAVTVYREGSIFYAQFVQRPKDDPEFPGEPWHTPGKGVAKGVTTAQRLRQIALPDESGLVASEPEFAGAVEYIGPERGAGKKLPGHWISLIWVRRLAHRPADGTYPGEFHPVGAPPKPCIWSHRMAILPVAANYLETGRPIYKFVRHEV